MPTEWSKGALQDRPKMPRQRFITIEDFSVGCQHKQVAAIVHKVKAELRDFKQSWHNTKESTKVQIIFKEKAFLQ